MGVPALSALLIIDLIRLRDNFLFRRIVVEDLLRLFLCLNHGFDFGDDTFIHISHRASFFLADSAISLLLHIGLGLLKQVFGIEFA